MVPKIVNPEDDHLSKIKSHQIKSQFGCKPKKKMRKTAILFVVFSIRTLDRILCHQNFGSKKYFHKVQQMSQIDMTFTETRLFLELRTNLETAGTGLKDDHSHCGYDADLSELEV